MARHRPLDNGMLPPLRLDWSQTVPRLLESAARQFSEGGVLVELMVDVEAPSGTAVIPMVCDIGSQDWAPYIEADAWNDEVVGRFVDWLSLIRASSYADIEIQFFSRYAVPEIVLALARNSGMARLQLDALNATLPFEYATNARLLQALVRRHLQVELPVDDGGVAAIDGIIDDHFGAEGPIVATQALVHLVGCFLGEVLVTCHGGTWVGSGLQVGVSPHGLAPLQVAVERFARGARGALVLHLPT